jgi:hypothetical protein
LLAYRRLFLEPSFCVDRGSAAFPGGRHGLSVAVVIDVAGNEYAFDVGRRGGALRSLSPGGTKVATLNAV